MACSGTSDGRATGHSWRRCRSGSSAHGSRRIHVQPGTNALRQRRQGRDPIRSIRLSAAMPGHTLHAVAFTTVASAYSPQLSWLLIPFTVLIALSRMVLGLHYPSDVIAGIGIAVIAAGTSLPLKSLALN
jgi:hypothetical protein